MQLVDGIGSGIVRSASGWKVDTLTVTERINCIEDITYYIKNCIEALNLFYLNERGSKTCTRFYGFFAFLYSFRLNLFTFHTHSLQLAIS